ncbi:hypothetical protein T492DRAFT_40733 [Pavlovales sp. CCMP2436]|nr:hypothetical protein T492DRAFT_40733 [Pavlovales sp. CCMP2436]
MYICVYIYNKASGASPPTIFAHTPHLQPINHSHTHKHTIIRRRPTRQGASSAYCLCSRPCSSSRRRPSAWSRQAPPPPSTCSPLLTPSPRSPWRTAPRRRAATTRSTQPAHASSAQRRRRWAPSVTPARRAQTPPARRPSRSLARRPSPIRLTRRLRRRPKPLAATRRCGQSRRAGRRRLSRLEHPSIR